LEIKKKRGTLSNPAPEEFAFAGTQLKCLAAILATTTPAATVSTTTTAATAAARTRTFFTRARFIHRQCPTVHFLAIQGLDSGIGAFLGIHGYKSETARAAAEFVHDDIYFENSAMGREEVLELVLGCVEGKVSNKQFRTHDDFAFRFTALSRPFPTIGFQIITETGSTEDLPGFEIGNLSIGPKTSQVPDRMQS